MASPYYRCPNCHNVSRKNDNMFEMVEVSGSNTLFVGTGDVPCPDCGASHSFDDVYLHPKYDVPIADVYGGKAGVNLQLVRSAHETGKIRLSEQELVLLPASLHAAASASMNKGNAGTKAPAQTTSSPLLSYWIPLGLIAILSAVFYFLSPVFVDKRNLLNVLFAVVTSGLIACAMTFMIASGDVDLSVGAVVGWVSMLFGVMVVNWQWPWSLAIVVVVLSAALVHTVAGIIRVTWQASAFLVTLALFTILKGAAIGLTEGAPIQFPKTIGGLASSDVVLLSLPLVIIAVILHLVGTRTEFGRIVYTRSSGSHPLRLFSPSGRTRLVVFALSGFMAAMTGVVYALRLGASSPTVGQGIEISVIAAVLLGGGRLAGGTGSIPGTLLWITLLAVLHNGMRLIELPFPTQYVMDGLILLLAVMVGMLPGRNLRNPKEVAN